MDDVFVGSVMSSPVHTVRADTALGTAGELMLEHGIGSVIVVDEDDKLEGILTATDFVRVVAEAETDSSAPVSTEMSTDITTTTADQSIQSVANVMLDHEFHHVPVVDDGTVIGVVTTTDLTAYLSTREAPTPA
ncbi:cyclic nucleotide-binding/CBS domain-containing protein [Halomarina salina]|uniref:Cyclic nucleotide-binding/CBS domain-containing protein n=1 Tax=Halomarina salina TaxID=1872699 RepID=A0ABD5RQZ3_9EURY|nr:CBS domain-containing protein [Halomarina salina]